MATLSFGPLICVNLTLVGTLVVIPSAKNLQLVISGMSSVVKDGLGFWTFFSDSCTVRAFSVPHLHSSFSRHRNKEEKNKSTFKERVEFPILECSVETRETEHSKTVAESSGRVSLPLNPYCYCTYVVSLWEKIGISGTRKTYENMLSICSA